MDRLIQCQQVVAFITHISTVDKLGVFVLMVLQGGLHNLNCQAHLRSMEFIVLIGVFLSNKVIDVSNIELK